MKKVYSIILASIFALSFLGGCTAKTKPQPKPTESKVEENKPSDKQVEITIWAFPTFATIDDTSGKYEKELAAAFTTANPNFKVNVEMIDFKNGPEKIVTAIQGGTAPDVVFDAPGRIIGYGKSGALANLNDIFTDELKKDINNEKLVNSCSDGKDFYMYPLSSAPFLMAVNQTLLEKEGLMSMVNTEGDRTWTTDQFTALNKALAAKGHKNAIVFCSGQGGDQGTRAFISNLYSGSITNKDLTAYTMDTPEGIKSMQYCVDQVKANSLVNGTPYNGGEAIEQFVSGNVTESLLWSPGIAKGNAAALKTAGVKALALPLPSDDGKPELEYLVNGFCAFDNGDEARIAASKEFIKFICDDKEWGPKNVLATGCFPVRQSFGNLYGDDAEMAFYSGMTKFYGTYYNTINGFASMRPAWFGNVQAALTGEKTAEDAMKNFVKAANQSIADQ